MGEVEVVGGLTNTWDCALRGMQWTRTPDVWLITSETGARE